MASRSESVFSPQANGGKSRKVSITQQDEVVADQRDINPRNLTQIDRRWGLSRITPIYARAAHNQIRQLSGAQKIPTNGTTDRGSAKPIEGGEEISMNQST